MQCQICSWYQHMCLSPSLALCVSQRVSYVGYNDAVDVSSVLSL